MKQKFILTFVALIASTVIAETAQVSQTNNVVTISTAKMEAIIENAGGMLDKPGTGLGVILFRNEQRRIPLAELVAPIEYLKKYTKLPIKYYDAEPSSDSLTRDGVRKLGANMLIVIKDDSSSPSPLLVAPDDAWAVVNVAALAKDNPPNGKLASRLRKEISRAFSFLCGGVNSQYEKTPANHCSSLRDLDLIDMDEVPADLIMRFKTYVQGYGVTPYIRATYKSACKHGWAPVPTNDVQKAIWDKYHEIPTGGIEIKFDPAKGE